MIVPKSMSHWFRFSLIALLIGLFLPASPALAQDGDPGKPRTLPAVETQPRITPSFAAAANLVQDPSFEASFSSSGSSSAYWIQSSTNSFIICATTGCGSHSDARPRTGSNWAWFGGISFTEPGDVSPEVGDVYQNVTFPAASCGASLQFYLWIGEARAGSDANDNFRALVDGRAVFTANATQKNSYNSYRLVSVDVSQYANGGVHKLEFTSRISGQYVSFNLDDISIVCATAVRGDYSGDGKADLAVFRPPASAWYIRNVGTFLFGGVGDIPVPADYNGDGRVDMAVFRASASTWYIDGVGAFLFGGPGDIPVVGDYNGDRKADMAVFRPSTSTWYIVGVGTFLFGGPGDVPAIGDYNGDGKDDMTVFRPSTSTWYIVGVGTFLFGGPGDIPVVADYNGDGKDDIAVFRPASSGWYMNGVGNFLFGGPGDIPVVSDYTGDGKADIAVFRPSNGTWYINGVGNFPFGGPGDIPVIDYIG